MLPDTWIFNPTCEPAIANGSPYYTPSARLRQFEHDLGYLPGWLGEEKDHVLVRGKVDPSFSLKMQRFGFRLPGFISQDQAFSDPEWLSLPKGRIQPWGWSPAVCRLFKNSLQSYRDDFQYSAVATWQPAHKRLYSRLTAIDLLGKIMDHQVFSWMPCRSDLPVVCSDLAQICNEISKHSRSVVKTPWSSSGRGLLLFPNIDSKKKNDELLSGMLNQQGFVTVEAWLDKVMDVSFQFYSRQGKIEYKGRTIFETDRKGRYVRNFLEEKVDGSDNGSVILEKHTAEVVDLLIDALSHSDYVSMYEGWIGVDALIYRSETGELKFHPMIEINGRFTMGAISLKMREYMSPGSKGYLQVYYSKNSNFQSFCREMEAVKPLIMKEHKIESGFLPLTPPMEEHYFGAYIEVVSNV